MITRVAVAYNLLRQISDVTKLESTNNSDQGMRLCLYFLAFALVDLYTSKGVVSNKKWPKKTKKMHLWWGFSGENGYGKFTFEIYHLNI